MSVLFILGDFYDVWLARKNKSLDKKKINFKPKFSVIVPAHNEEKVIIKTIESVLRSTYKNFEVIVVDDGSTDMTSKIVREYKKEKNISNLRLITKRKNAGKASGLNYAIKNYAKGELIMCLDADSVLAEDALDKATKYFLDPKVAGMATNVKISNADSLIGIMQKVEYLIGFHLKKSLTVANIEYIVGGAGSIFRKKVLQRVNYYDTDTLTEDIDLAIKVIREGNKDNKVIFGSDVICFTQGPLSYKALYKQRLRWKMGRFQTFMKNREMFFNTNSEYSRLLTIVYLPFTILSELTFLIDPLFLIAVGYFAIRSGNLSGYIGMFVFMFFFVSIAILSDKYSNWIEKIKFLLVAPLSYLFFFTISIVEYIGLIKCIIDFKKILLVEKGHGRSTWVHVERAA